MNSPTWHALGGGASTQPGLTLMFAPAAEGVSNSGSLDRRLDGAPSELEIPRSSHGRFEEYRPMSIHDLTGPLTCLGSPQARDDR